LRQAEAIFARNLLGATPADAVRPVPSLIAALIFFATVIPSGSPHRFSVTSRYASSSDKPSTRGVTSRKIAKTCCDTGAVLLKVRPTICSEGHRRIARDIGIADRTPNLRAS
jgi:hypothetical protein